MCVINSIYCTGCKVSSTKVNLCELGLQGIICVNEQLSNADTSWKININECQPKSILSSSVLFPNKIINSAGTTLWNYSESNRSSTCSIPAVSDKNGTKALIFGLLPVNKIETDSCSSCSSK